MPQKIDSRDARKEKDEKTGKLLREMYLLLHGPRQVGRQHRVLGLVDQLMDLWVEQEDKR